METLQSLFRSAILAGDVRQVSALLRRDESLAAKSMPPDDDDYPLYRATEQGNVELAKLLLQHGADVDRPEQCGTGGAIQCAVEQGHYAVAHVLLDHGANVDATPDSNLPMVSRLYEAAVEAGASPDLVRKGLEHYLGPASVESPGENTDNENTPDVIHLFYRVLSMGGQPGMFSIVRHQPMDLLRELLTRCPNQPGTKFDWPQGTLFFNISNAASWLGYPEVLELCRQTCPQLYDAAVARLAICRAIGSHNRDGCHSEYRRLVENQLTFMQQRGELDVELMSPLHWLGNNFLESRTYGFKCQELPTVDNLIDFANLFLQYGFNINFRPSETNLTPLAVAAGDGPIEYVVWLLEHGADLCSEDPDETNPLSIAKRKSRAEIVELLLSKHT